MEDWLEAAPGQHPAGAPQKTAHRFNLWAVEFLFIFVRQRRCVHLL
jgi:hypothetical protein